MGLRLNISFGTQSLVWPQQTLLTGTFWSEKLFSELIYCYTNFIPEELFSELIWYEFASQW